MRCRHVVLVIIVCLAAFPLFSAPQVRIKDIAYLSGIRENQLSGIGLVTGLSGKGDSSGSLLLKKTLSNLLSHFNIEISVDDMKSKNCAVVMVNMEVPAFVRPGDRVNVSISSIGDARSLEGGILLQTNLQAANAQVYAVAQGKLLTASSDKAVSTIASIPGGAIIEHEIISNYIQNGVIKIVLRNPDFITAKAVADAIRKVMTNAGVNTLDASMIEVTVPEDRKGDIVGFIAEIEALKLTPDVAGKIVVNPNTGIIIVGDNVRIGKVAVSYRDVNVSVGSSFYIDSEEEKKDKFVINDTASVEDLIEVLRTAGLKADIIIGILQAIERAGSLYGDLIIM